ncbi:hypothetical protein N7499_003695 [Penicillium canescens]|uniref:Fido domain-containing protein n=1 Tax=Penicillium canescens TaxID=5083 RepID=A0AAD6IAA0_PENCN|nr:uncharacterized protein N7446_012674 [Penicillium canescens]KAJ6018381.1 hypothetical protein N7522_001845 [Penicillium canescens]KAJ6019707.1 hypothetical protein N7522_001774 [Penicillium canescens]KAJ6038862.1 hypothetical protein N7460_007579 [Penicillium canescens]KAJ6045810.1 hypothetical protein N7446_012674 [Penicillium canescens]KAJ6066396.1 hypothetical protein N7444_000149 [Penicillium canescens]
MLRFLTVSQVQRLHARFVVPNAVPVQPNMLESAIHSPMNMKHYAKEEDVFQLAANLAEKIMLNHAFQDGNKRTALLAADMFLKINGFYLQKVPFAEDLHNKALANAHVAVSLAISFAKASAVSISICCFAGSFRVPWGGSCPILGCCPYTA